MFVFTNIFFEKLFVIILTGGGGAMSVIIDLQM